MPAPRAPGAVFLSKNQTRQMENRNNAQQQALYAATEVGLPQTFDPGLATGRFTQSATTNRWMLTKLKNYRGGDRVGRLRVYTVNAGAPTFTVALCETAVSEGRLVVSEVSRGTVVGVTSGGSVVANDVMLVTPITLDGRKSYCIALNLNITFPDTVDVISIATPGGGANGVPNLLLRSGSTVLVSDPCTFTWDGVAPGVSLIAPVGGARTPFYAVALPPVSEQSLASQYNDLWY